MTEVIYQLCVYGYSNIELLSPEIASWFLWHMSKTPFTMYSYVTERYVWVYLEIVSCVFNVVVEGSGVIFFDEPPRCFRCWLWVWFVQSPHRCLFENLGTRTSGE